MRKTIFTIITFAFISFSNFLNAQAPDWAWAKSAGNAADDESRSVATDASGNVFITGYFTGANITFGATTLISGGNSGIYIVKYDTNGNVLWAKSAGGAGTNMSNGITIDATGNALITGYFQSPAITFGTTTLTNTAASTIDIFFAKYDTNGNVLWAKSAGGIGEDNSNGIAVDANGNVFLTGYFKSPAITFGTNTLTNTGNDDIFIVKYDAGGNLLWAKSAVGTSVEQSLSVATDASGNVIITGYFKSPTIAFGTTTLTNSSATTNYYDIFIIKLDAGGNVIWAKSIGNSSNFFGRCVATDISGNIFVTGEFKGSTISFGTITLTNANTSLVLDTRDIFIVKYDAAGNVLWAKREGGNNDDTGNRLASDVNGNVYMTGWFSGSSITFGTATFIPNGTIWSDIFIVKYDSNGNVVWAKGAGGGNTEFSQGVASDASGNVFITGLFVSATVSFGLTTLTNIGSRDTFIAKIGGTLSVEEQSDNSGMVIAPNPFTSETTISFKEEQVNTTIKIIDILGKEIQSIQFNGMQFILEKGKMQPGIYVVQVLDANNTLSTRKIAIQ